MLTVINKELRDMIEEMLTDAEASGALLIINNGGEMSLYCKGSPNKALDGVASFIAHICKDEGLDVHAIMEAMELLCTDIFNMLSEEPGVCC